MTNLLIITPIFPPEIGGPATYVSTLISKLPKNINSKVITFSSHSSANKNITTISTKQNSVFRQIKLFIQILKHIKNSDTVYLQGTLTCGLSTLFVYRLTSKPYFLKYVGDEAWENYKQKGGSLSLESYLSKHKNTFKFKLNKIILSNAKNIIVPSKYLQDILKKYYEVNSTIIPNSIEIPKIKINKNKKSIIYVGRLVKWKNVDKLIMAFSKLSKDWKLNIIGDGPGKNCLQKLTRKLNLDSQIRFYGKQNKKKTLNLISKAEYLVLLSDYEGLSHTLLEAMSLKCKIIASNIKANSDLLNNGEYGILVNQNNQKEILNSIKKAYKQIKINKAYTYLTNNYSWKKHINKLTEIFKNE